MMTENVSMLTENVPMLTERLPMLTENVHLVPLQGHVTGTCLLIIVKLITHSVSERGFAPSLCRQGANLEIVVHDALDDPLHPIC